MGTMDTYHNMDTVNIDCFCIMLTAYPFSILWLSSKVSSKSLCICFIFDLCLRRILVPWTRGLRGQWVVLGHLPMDAFSSPRGWKKMSPLGKRCHDMGKHRKTEYKMICAHISIIFYLMFQDVSCVITVFSWFLLYIVLSFVFLCSCNHPPPTVVSCCCTIYDNICPFCLWFSLNWCCISPKR